MSSVLHTFFGSVTHLQIVFRIKASISAAKMPWHPTRAKAFSSVFHSFLFGVLQNSSASHFAFCQLQYLSATYFFYRPEIAENHPLTSPLPPVLNTVSR